MNVLPKRAARGVINAQPRGRPRGVVAGRKRAGYTRNTGTTPARRQRMDTWR